MIIIIPQNSHYSTGWSLGKTHWGRTSMSYMVKFSASCLELPGVFECDGDFNKLFGWSYGWHHSNSIRIGWKAVDNKIRLAMYTYEDGKRYIKGFAWANVEVMNQVSINYDPVTCVIEFKLNDKSAYMMYYKKPSFGYNLMPYFGGQCPAPTTMEIQLL